MVNFLQTVILLGSLQGFIIGSLLFFSKKNRRSSRILAVLIFLISLASLNLYGSYQNWFPSGLPRLIVDIIPTVMVMPLGPLIWFYIRASLDPAFVITKKLRLHFWAVVIDLVPSLTVITALLIALTKIVRTDFSKWGVFIDNYNVYADIPRWISLVVYLWLSHRYIRQYKANTADPDTRIKWLRSFVGVMLVFQCIWLVYLVPYVIPSLTDKVLNLVDWYPIYIPMTFLIYWLGIKGLLMSAHIDIPPRKSSLSQLSPQIVNEAVAALQRLMEENRLYLNPALNLKMVSDHSGIPQKTISAVLNQKMRVSFNEYVNGYRVSEFKKRIHGPGTEQFTIAGIAMECGFNSQATFQRTFKQLTGMSPAAFRDRLFEHG